MTDRTLTLSNVSVSRGRAMVLTGVNVVLEPAQIVAVVGANGTGKSTLLAAIAGHLAHSGSIRWQGSAISAQSAGYMPQSADGHSALTVREAVLLGRFDSLAWRVATADLDAASEALAALNLFHLADRPLDTLSGGQRQLVLLAQRLVRQPQLLILDEATSALDLRHQMNVLHHLRGYIERTGALILIAIHDINLAARHADQVLLLSNGTVSGSGRCYEVLTPENLRRAFGVETEILRSSSGHPVIVPVGVNEP